MKCMKIAAAVVLCLGVGQAFAQTCAAPTALTAAGVSNVNGCAQSNTVSVVCSFANNPSPDTIFSFTLGAGFTATAITLTNVTGSPFQPQMILQQACGSTDECLVTGNAASVGAGTSLTLTGQAAGAYFLVVNGTSTGSAADCGTFSLALNGTLPVQLQKFSVD
ncbi:MAG TPA: hypothetical protein VFI49_02075 [Rudaea sp.]|nr:hypothetical protein [Rudaea sp.]